MPQRNESALTQARQKRGLTLDIVAQDLGISKTTLHRIEKGVASVIPKERAAKIYEYFDGEVPLANIYDPTFEEPADHEK